MKIGFLNTQEKKRSFVISTIILLLLFILGFFPVFTYETPTPIEKEIVNLELIGFSVNNDTGGGAQASTTKSNSASEATTTPTPTPEVNQKQTTPNKVETQTQESSNTVQKTQTEEKNTEEQAPNPKYSFGGSGDSGDADNGSSGNPGDSGRGGRSGDGKGEGSDGFNGPGVGGNLSGRKLLSQPDLDSDCSTKGKVVLKIIVNGAGQVLQANIDPGQSNTTNTCLVAKAIDEAKKLKWQASDKPSVTGYITFNFK